MHDFDSYTQGTAPGRAAISHRPRPVSAVDWQRIQVTPAMHAAVATYLIGKGPLWLESVLALTGELPGAAS